MERVTFYIERQDVVDALYARAAAVGRTVEAELASLVERTYAPGADALEVKGENSIEKLIRIGRALDIQVPPRTAEPYEPPRLW